MSKSKKLLAKAIQLDDVARTRLAGSIAHPEPRGEAAWIAEIEGRARRALAEESKGIDVDAAVDRISRDLGL